MYRNAPPAMPFFFRARLCLAFSLLLATSAPAQIAKPPANAANPPAKAATPPKPDAKQAAQDQVTQQEAAKAVASSVVLKVAPPLDVQAKSKEVMEHLSAVIRNYRTAVALVQKVGEPSDSVYREQSSA